MTDEERQAREEKDRIYKAQRDAALASVRGGRAARSFVVIPFPAVLTFAFASPATCTRFDIIVPAASIVPEHLRSNNLKPSLGGCR